MVTCLNDLENMSQENQRYFGDWVNFNGRGDVGYYLGAKYARFLLNYDSFDRVISYDIEQVKAGFELFLKIIFKKYFILIR